MTLIYNNFDAIMLGFMDTAKVVGYYGSAYKILIIFVGAFTVWTTTVFPVSTKKINESKVAAQQFLDKYLKLTMLIVLPVVVSIFFAAPAIILLIYGQEYLAAILALKIIIWTLIIIAIASAYGMLLLIPAGHFSQLFKSVMVGAVINIIFNFALIPRYSLVGAAVATIIAELAVLGMLIYFSRKILILSLFKNLYRPIIFSALAGLIVFLYAMLGFQPGVYLTAVVHTVIFGSTYLMVALLFERVFIFEFAKEIVRKN